MNVLTNKLKGKFKSTWKPMKITPQPKTSGHSKGGHKRELYSNSSLPKEGRKISDTQPNLMTKELEMEQQIKPKTSRRQEIIKIRAEINAIKTKKAVEQINETRSWSLKELTKLINH